VGKWIKDKGEKMKPDDKKTENKGKKTSGGTKMPLDKIFCDCDVLTDGFYKDFHDPTAEFYEKEHRAFCYDVSRRLIEEAKNQDPANWHTHEKTINGILLLLFCWNYRAIKTKGLKRENVIKLLEETKEYLEKLKNERISDFDNLDEWDKEAIKRLYAKFKELFGQTGASKALSLINTELFVMWDSKIRERLKKFPIFRIKKIDNGKKPEHYLNFLEGMNGIVKEYKLEEKILKGSSIAKKLDEYNYVEIIMKSKKKVGKGLG